MYNQLSTHIPFTQYISANSQLLQTFQPLNLPHFLLSELYWEIALTICWGHGKYFAGKTLCVLWHCDESDDCFFLWKSSTSALLEIDILIRYWLVVSNNLKKITAKVLWICDTVEFPISFGFRDLEMMSAACIPVVGIIKKGGVSFQTFFFLGTVTTHSFGIQRRSAEFLRFKLEVRWRIWSLDSYPCSFQASIPWNWSYAEFPVLPYTGL